MRKLFGVAVLAAALAMLPGPAVPQVAGTITLTLQANWDDGTPVVGTVTFTGTKQNTVPAVISAGVLTATGGYTFSGPKLDWRTLYVVTLDVPTTGTTPAGTKRLLELPFMTIGVDPATLVGLHTTLVFYKVPPLSGALIKTETDAMDKFWP